MEVQREGGGVPTSPPPPSPHQTCVDFFTSFLNSKFFQLKVCILPLILKDLKYGCWEIFLCLSRFWCEKSILVFQYQNLDPPHQKFLPMVSSSPPPPPQISLDSLTVHCIYPFVRAGKRVQSLLPKHINTIPCQGFNKNNIYVCFYLMKNSVLLLRSKSGGKMLILFN